MFLPTLYPVSRALLPYRIRAWQPPPPAIRSQPARLGVVSSALPRPTAHRPGIVATPFSGPQPSLLTPRLSFRLTLRCKLPLLSHHSLLKSSSLFRTWPQVPFLWATSPGSYRNQSLLTSQADDSYTNINSPSLMSYLVFTVPL